MKKIRYNPEQYRVLKGDPLRAQKAQTKWYTLWPAHHTLPPIEALQEARTIALQKIDHCIPEHYSKSGLTILSPNLLNIIFWNHTKPLLAHPHCYELERKGIRQTIRQQDIRKVGPFCLHEMQLLMHDWPFWETFLRSQQTKTDLEEYLSTGFTGNLE